MVVLKDRESERPQTEPERDRYRWLDGYGTCLVGGHGGRSRVGQLVKYNSFNRRKWVVV